MQDQAKQQIIVINLDSDKDRFDRLSQALEQQGAEALRLSALRGSSLPRLFFAKLDGAAGAEPGTLGCFLSHVRAWENILERGWDGAIILEDDAELIRPLHECQELFQDHDLVFLNDRMTPAKPKNAQLTDWAQTVNMTDAILARVESRSTACGGDGYWLSRQGAQQMIEAINQMGVWRDVDWLLLFAAVGKSGLEAIKAHRIFHRKLSDMAMHYDFTDPILRGAALKVAAVQHPGHSSPRKDENATAAALAAATNVK